MNELTGFVGFASEIENVMLTESNWLIVDVLQSFYTHRRLTVTSGAEQRHREENWSGDFLC